MKASWKTVSENLDRLFFLPFASNETPALRAEMIEAYLHAYGYTWDMVLDQIIKPEGN